MPDTSKSLPWSEKDYEILREFYPRKDGKTQMATLMPYRTYYAIRSKAQDLGIKRRPRKTKNLDFFSEPNEFNCAVAGFIAADGCISDTGKLTINLSEKDLHHLEKIKSILGYDGGIYRYKPKVTWIKNYKNPDKPLVRCDSKGGRALQIQCPQWKTDLEKHWNITPRKTLTLLPPNLTGNRLKMSYISGEIDGDGWIYSYVEKGPKPRTTYSLAVMGTRELMEWIKATLDALVPNSSFSNLKPEGKSGNSFSYKITGAKAYWVSKMMLSLDVLRLDRKWDMMRELIRGIEQDVVPAKIRFRLIQMCPSEETLREFGLLEDKAQLFTRLNATPIPCITIS